MTAGSQLRGLATRVSDQFSLVPSKVEFGRFLDQANDNAQSKQLFDLLSVFALNFDCPWVAYRSLTPNQKAVRRDTAGILNYPGEWQRVRDNPWSPHPATFDPRLSAYGSRAADCHLPRPCWDRS